VTGPIVLTRALQLAPALILFGSLLFTRYGLDPGHAPPPSWLRPLLLVTAALASLATAGWLLAEAASFDDDPQRLLPAWATLQIVLFQTRFGAVALLRSLLLAVSFLLLLPALTAARLRWVLASAAVAVASFAGTGHGGSPGGEAGVLHLLTDVLHLWTAGIWLGSLAALCLSLLTGGIHAGEVTRGLLRFSVIGPGVVALLTITGIGNAFFLLGHAPWHALLVSTYGRTLLVKLALLLVMLACAGINRYVLTPQLTAGTANADASSEALRRLRRVLGLETAAGLTVIGVVAELGTLPPPV
jgi:putative copper resistance protein D